MRWAAAIATLIALLAGAASSASAARTPAALKNVIGHNESLSSPFHHERVPAFAHQTHSDWDSADMHVYRERLARLPCPSVAGSLAAPTESGTGGI